MCRSLKDGGGRCYSHANQDYQTTLTKIQEVKDDLEQTRKDYRQNAEYARYIANNTEEFKERYGDKAEAMAEVVHKRLNETTEKGKTLSRRLDFYNKKAKHQLSVVRSTKKGLDELATQIEQTNDPEEKKSLRIAHNAGSRVYNKRADLRAKIKENRAEAAEMREEAKNLTEEMNDITGNDEASVSVREEIRVERDTLVANAYLKENNGRMEVKCLYDAKTGEIVPAVLQKSQFGTDHYNWKFISDPTNPQSKSAGKLVDLPRGKTLESRKAFYEKKGLVLGTCWVPGSVRVGKDGSGATQVTVHREDGGFSLRAMHGQKDYYAGAIREAKKSE